MKLEFFPRFSSLRCGGVQKLMSKPHQRSSTYDAMHFDKDQRKKICRIRLTLPAEVENNLKFPLHMGYLVLFFKVLFIANSKKPPPGSSQVPPNSDPTSTLEL